MAITFLQLANKVLGEVKQPLSATEIWDVAAEKNYTSLVASQGKTPWATMAAQIYVDVRDNPSTDFVPVGARPKRFILKSQLDILPIIIPDTINPPHVQLPKFEFFEKDLHAFMAYFGFYYLKAFLKTISHSKSGKRSFGEWVHPDIVGCYFPYKDWAVDVVEFSALMGNNSIKLFSFELKRELSLSNIRESFFQAVSNSSWANEGYLAAADIDADDDFRSELKRLSTAFGIGIIHLKIDDPDASEIILPARSKENIDWDTVNKLSSINPDFCEFLKRVRNDMKNQEVRKELYDNVLEREELIKSITKKKSTA